jgi:ABC-type transport system involved in multi-copper enzyme maturation permease subunit
MLALLIGKEIRAHVLSYRFVLTFMLFFVLIVSSVQIIALNYDRQLANFSESQRAQEEKLKETDFRSMRWRGTQVERRPNPLSVFAMGLEKEMARSVGISQMQEAKLGRSKYANPLFVLFPAPDLLYIVNIVASLLAVLFAFDAVCGEGEEGTLKLVMSNSVPRHLVLLAKWIGGYVALILPFLISVLCALFFAQLTTSLSFTGDEWGAFAGILGVAVLYISLFYALSLMISTLVHRASTSLVVNFLIWVMLVLVVPNTAPIVARALAPVPSVGVIAGQKVAIQRDIWNGVRRQMRGNRGGRNNEERQQAFDDAQAKIREETEKLTIGYLQKVDEQISLGVLLARLSPSASYVYATAGLAGSGLGDFGGLREYIKRYRQEFMTKVQDIEQVRRKLAENAADQTERQEIMEAPVEPGDLPVFAPGRGGWSEVLADSQVDLIILLVLNVVFFLGSYLGFLRYDLMK